MYNHEKGVFFWCLSICVCGFFEREIMKLRVGLEGEKYMNKVYCVNNLEFNNINNHHHHQQLSLKPVIMKAVDCVF